jgi:hypothetical protein
MTTASILCQLNNGCMGCCGHNFTSELKIKEAVNRSTLQFKQMNPKKQSEFIKFKERYHVNDLQEGVCRNLIEEKGCYLCPLHPTRHKGEDLRLGHCDVNYLCTTATQFESWHKRKQEQFIEFIEGKGLNNVKYSLMMDGGSLLKEFEKGEG